MIPTNPEKFKTMVLWPQLATLRLNEILRERKKLEETKKFELITSEEFEPFLDNPNFIRMDDPLSAIIGFTNLFFDNWKIMPIEMMSDSLKNKLINIQNQRKKAVA